LSNVLPFPIDFSPDTLREAVDCLGQGGIVSLATESFYALAAGVTHPEAIERVARMKGGGAEKPILVLIGDKQQLSDLVSTIPPSAEPLMNQFWPGPLTLIFPALPHLSSGLTKRTGTIGIRLPKVPNLRSLLRETGPLTGTSANRSGAQPALTAQEVQKEFGETIDLILDSGPAPGGQPSTVMNMVGALHIIRQGPIQAESLDQALALKNGLYGHFVS